MPGKVIYRTYAKILRKLDLFNRQEAKNQIVFVELA
jgi:hypothetical protein